MTTRSPGIRFVAQLAAQALAVCGLVSLTSACVASEAAVTIPAPTVDTPKSAGPLQKAVLSGGCFWGVQGVFEHLIGVHKVVAGYSGGEAKTAQYETVSGGGTGHAESVEITYDPQEVSYGQILQVFFSVTHDPTQLNRQGPDTGTQYRSSIFYSNDEQKKVADAYIAQLGNTGAYHGKIVTRVDPFKAFYPAEGYHQDFLIHNPTYPYIVINDLPKIRNFKQTLPALYRDKPVLLTAAR